MPYEAQLEATYYIDSDHPEIQNTVRRLSEDCAEPAETIQKIYHFVRDQIPYNMYAVAGNQEYYKASKILSMGNGFCVQKAILFTAMARAAGIPSRLVLVAIRNHLTPSDVVQLLGGNVFFPHAYSQFLIDGQWINVAATYDRSLCERLNVPVPDFDGRSDTLLPKADNTGRQFIEYVANYGVFDDLPWQFIQDTIPAYYDSGWEFWFGDEPVYIRYKKSGSGLG